MEATASEVHERHYYALNIAPSKTRCSTSCTTEVWKLNLHPSPRFVVSFRILQSQWRQTTYDVFCSWEPTLRNIFTKLKNNFSNKSHIYAIFHRKGEFIFFTVSINVFMRLFSNLNFKKFAPHCSPDVELPYYIFLIVQCCSPSRTSACKFIVRDLSANYANCQTVYNGAGAYTRALPVRMVFTSCLHEYCQGWLASAKQY
jgi:hypothetical protein